MPVKRVVFIRPGETDWNKSGRWQGQVQIPLNEHGKMQSKRLAEFLRNIGLSALYSSDLRRAVETAEIIGEHLNLTPQFDQRLREREIGRWQGLTLDEIRRWYPDEYAHLREDPDGFQIPNGESRKQVANRLEAFFYETWENWKTNNNDVTVGMVSHSTALRMLLANLIPDSKPYEMQFRNMSVTTLMRDDRLWMIAQLDDVSHLEGMPTFAIKEVEEDA